jgi:hypothetical protein
MWNLWKERNEIGFAGTHWHVDKLSSKIWLGMVDYGRLAWSRILAHCKKNTYKVQKTKKQFSETWCSNNVLATWVNNHPRWVLIGPTLRSLGTQFFPLILWPLLALTGPNEVGLCVLFLLQ